MDYPDGFNTPTFPAGPRIAVSRVVGIAIMVVFLLILCACGLLLWTQRSVRVHPFLVSVNNITGQWEIVGHNHSVVREITTDRALQEATIGRFMRYWFLITANPAFNDSLWTECKRESDCNPDFKTGIETARCGLYCLSGANAFSAFLSDVVPSYRLRAAQGETWMLNASSLQFLPLESADKNAPAWQVSGTITSNISGPINILAYVKIGRDMDLYPQTMGYFVSEFNAYKMD